MTAFTTADLPSSIDTVEKLVVWGIQVLKELNMNAPLVRENNIDTARRPIETSWFQSYDANNGYRFYGRLTLPLADTYATSGNKIWAEVQPLSDVAISAHLKTD